VKIFIGYDGSQCSRVAIEDLQRAGLPGDVQALVVTAAETALRPTPTVAQDAVDLLRSIFPKWDVDCEEHGGSAARVLIDRSDVWKPDLVVVGSHGRSAIGRLMLGSVSQKIVTEATCSVRIGRRSRHANDAPVRVLIGTDGSSNATAAVHTVAKRRWPARSARTWCARSGELPEVKRSRRTRPYLYRWLSGKHGEGSRPNKLWRTQPRFSRTPDSMSRGRFALSLRNRCFSPKLGTGWRTVSSSARRGRASWID
jgi:nucleotide-binding universal stress UspA family protein